MYTFDRIIGKSKALQRIFMLLEKIIDSSSTVLIEGESGVGKELICHAIHYNSPRKDKPLVIQNCSGLNENLLESELFGHVRGSFTGAISDKKGLFEVADKGTFLLDEIAEMSPLLQVKLLRVLQEGTFTKVGGIIPQKVDVRIIVATNKNLEQLVKEGKFREDLFYRLNVIKVEVPPLRERKEDIPLLVDYFLEKHAAKWQKKNISERALEMLLNYDWPGNIRELENEIEKLVLLSGKQDLITKDMLSIKIKEAGDASMRKGFRKEGKLKDAIRSLEKEMIMEGLRRNMWNKSRVSKELGISRAGLIRKIQEYGLDRRKQSRAKNPDQKSKD
jgi:two-component system response regulator HupR/HoxA